VANGRKKKIAPCILGARWEGERKEQIATRNAEEKEEKTASHTSMRHARTEDDGEKARTFCMGKKKIVRELIAGERARGEKGLRAEKGGTTG